MPDVSSVGGAITIFGETESNGGGVLAVILVAFFFWALVAFVTQVFGLKLGSVPAGASNSSKITHVILCFVTSAGLSVIAYFQVQAFSTQNVFFALFSVCGGTALGNTIFAITQIVAEKPSPIALDDDMAVFLNLNKEFIMENVRILVDLHKSGQVIVPGVSGAPGMSSETPTAAASLPPPMSSGTGTNNNSSSSNNNKQQRGRPTKRHQRAAHEIPVFDRKAVGTFMFVDVGPEVSEESVFSYFWIAALFPPLLFIPYFGGGRHRNNIFLVVATFIAWGGTILSFLFYYLDMTNRYQTFWLLIGAMSGLIFGFFDILGTNSMHTACMDYRAKEQLAEAQREKELSHAAPPVRPLAPPPLSTSYPGDGPGTPPPPPPTSTATVPSLSGRRGLK